MKKHDVVNISMNLIIKPHEGVGSITFGMPMKEARATLNSPYKQFKRGLSKTFTDSFGELGVFILYSLENTCVGIEMASPSCPTLFDKPIIGQPFSEIFDWLKSQDADLELDSSGCKSSKLGVSIYAPGRKFDPNDPVEAVLAFQKGYYERSKLNA
jgi:hypothetical protein